MATIVCITTGCCTRNYAECFILWSQCSNLLFLMKARMNMGTPPLRPPASPGSLMDPQQQAFMASLLVGYNPFALFGGVPLMDQSGIEQNARNYRNAASYCEPTCTWSGQLPPRNYKNPMYSCKIFVGGVPWDITEGAIDHYRGH